eukprot:4626065-Prymnesium_polylepis.1
MQPAPGEGSPREHTHCRERGAHVHTQRWRVAAQRARARARAGREYTVPQWVDIRKDIHYQYLTCVRLKEEGGRFRTCTWGWASPCCSAACSPSDRPQPHAARCTPTNKPASKTQHPCTRKSQ